MDSNIQNSVTGFRTKAVENKNKHEWCLNECMEGQKLVCVIKLFILGIIKLYK